ncbi:MAG TPA: chromate resistance protein ChrB domain-containing protein [Anaerolineales bacterium]
MKWVTWENIGVDRMACIWLIRRWIDRKAEFLFIPAGEKTLPKGAEPFDIPGARYSHHRGHCTFYTLLKENNLKDPVLMHIANIIDEADIVQEVNVEPVAAGLDMICRGIRLSSPDDYIALERGAIVYDALYAQLSMESR